MFLPSSIIVSPLPKLPSEREPCESLGTGKTRHLGCTSPRVRRGTQRRFFCNIWVYQSSCNKGENKGENNGEDKWENKGENEGKTKFFF